MKEAEQIMKRCQVGTRNYNEANNLHADCYRVIGKLLKTIEEMESKEPVETVKESLQVDELLYEMLDTLPYNTPEYWMGRIKEVLSFNTHPPQRTWVGLTDEEIRERWFAEKFTLDGRPAFYNYARAIEAKLKEKNI